MSRITVIALVAGFLCVVVGVTLATRGLAFAGPAALALAGGALAYSWVWRQVNAKEGR